MTAQPPGQDSGAAFDRETAIQRLGPGRWSTVIHPSWNINQNPNGGYVQAIVLRAMVDELGGHGDPLSLTSHFLRPAATDQTAELDVQVLRAGRRTSTVRASMVQGGKPRLEAVCTLGDLGPGRDAAGQLDDFAMTIEPPELPPPDRCINRLELAQGVDLPLLSRVEVRINPEQAAGPAPEQARAGSKAAEPADITGWIRFADRRPVDTAALTLFADCLPPSIFRSHGPIGWVPTIELTVHVRKRPAEGWILSRFTTAELTGDLLVEDGVLWDETGAVVAQCRQLAMLAPA